MPAPEIILRPADRSEAGRVAEIARISRQHFLPYLPDLHSLDDDRAFYRNRVFPTCEVWVAEDSGTLVGICAFKEGWIEQLYVLPTHVGLGLGEGLVNIAKQGQQQLHLMVFQQNTRAISFYRRNGFRLIRETDGSNCEEKLPDALYEWRRAP